MKMLGKTHSPDAGGRKCVCCYPSKRNWKAMNRSAKRRERQAWKKSLHTS